MIASLLFMGGLRRSEVSALEWRDVSDARDGDGVLLTVRTSKTTNQEGAAADVRYLKNGAAKAIRTLRAADAAPTGSGDRVVPATDSEKVHRRRPRRRHRGALDGAQWPGRARVRTDGAREEELSDERGCNRKRDVAGAQGETQPSNAVEEEERQCRGLACPRVSR